MDDGRFARVDDQAELGVADLTDEQRAEFIEQGNSSTPPALYALRPASLRVPRTSTKPSFSATSSPSRTTWNVTSLFTMRG